MLWRSFSIGCSFTDGEGGGKIYFVSLPHSGGGVDCTKLSDDKFSLADLEDQTGDWQRVGAYSSWLSARIFEETQPGT